MLIDSCISERKHDIRAILKIAKDPSYQFSSSKKKGDLFENLAKLLLESPYLYFYKGNKRTKTAEIDLLFKVNKCPGTIFESFSDLLLVECKNWKAKAKTSDLRVFSSKMSDMHSSVGVFLSKNGVTGEDGEVRDAKGFARDQWRASSQVIIIIDLEDVDAIIGNRGKGLYQLFEEKFYGAKSV